MSEPKPTPQQKKFARLRGERQEAAESARVVRKIGWAVVLILIGVVSVFSFEPTEPPRIEKADIVAYRRGSRGAQYFTAVSRQTGQSFDVGAARGPYAPEYRGAVVLAIRRGRWTGTDHVEFWNGDTK